MFLAVNFLGAIARILDIVLSAYLWCIIIRALLSWVNPDPWNPIVRFLQRVTEPVLAPIRRLLPVWRLGIDVSPIVVILAIYFVRDFLVASLFDLAGRMR